MNAEELNDLRESNKRAEDLLNKCAELLANIDKQMPEKPDYVFHKEKLHVVADALRFATAELFLIRSALERQEKAGQ